MQEYPIKCKSLSFCFSDNVIICLSYSRAPDYFNESWLSKIKSEDVTNWRLKVSNLKKILKGILEYNLEVCIFNHILVVYTKNYISI